MTDQVPPSSALEAIRRWEAHGGTWSVLARDGHQITISLRTCTADEEVERLTDSADDLRAHVGDRDRSDEPD